MKDRIKKIYDMMYSPILTPYNILENVKLKNYKYVKYYTNNIGIVAEMQCVISDDDIKTFYYQFDNRDFLVELYCNTDGEKEVLFERDTEINNAKKEYYDCCKKQNYLIG